jgi:hypothetical protein
MWSSRRSVSWTEGGLLPRMLVIGFIHLWGVFNSFWYY